VYTDEEIQARVHIRLKQYVKNLDIEAQTMAMLVRQYVIPSSQKYQAELAMTLKGVADAGVTGVSVRAQQDALRDLTETLDKTYMVNQSLAEEMKKAHATEHVEKVAEYFGSKVAPLMADLRVHCDKLESIVSDELWPLPKYREMLFIR